jgi:membrane-anchored mycosin MYCP
MAYGAVEDYQPSELVVALPDLNVVKKALADLQVAIPKEDPDTRLGLALLTMENVARAADELRSQDPQLVRRVTDAKWPRGAPQGTGPSDLDLLLYKLREVFANAYGGWTPVIGKNRMIAPVLGFPYVGGCTAGDPWLLGFADPNPRLASSATLGWQPRPAEPGNGVRVGLLDTQLYPNPWLDGGYLATEEDLLEVPKPGGQPRWATAGHGTFIAGLILRQAPGAGIIVRSVMGPDARGKTWGVAKAMARFAGTGVHILNLSFGCYTDDGEPPLVLAKAVSLLSPQTLLVAAAGNHGNVQRLRAQAQAQGSHLADADWMTNLTDNMPVWPGAFPEVTAVGATDGGRQLADFTPKVPWIDVTAPGVDVESTYLDEDVRLGSTKGTPTQRFHGFARWNGTSFAAASVSGAIAAKVGPGRDAWQALEAVLADPNNDILPFR